VNWQISFVMNQVSMMCTCCADRKPASITAINLPLKRVVLNPFPRQLDTDNPLYSTKPTLFGQKYFFHEKSYVTDNRT